MIRPHVPLVLTMSLTTLALGACTWVRMEPEAARVRVLPAGASVQGCTPRGEIGVSVRDRVGLYQRNELKVRDELETLARNEAPGLGADTIQPLEEPSLGEQRFAAFRCGMRTSPRAQTRPQPSAAAPREAVETYPIRND